MKNNTFNEMIKPIIVLLVICLVVSALLGFTNSVTAPIIEENERIAAEQTRAAVLEGSNGFTEIECDTAALGITSAYKENNGLGYVITAANKGYGGDVVVTVGLDADGKVVGLSANVGTETSGVGTKAGTEAYTGNYIVLSGNCDNVDTISGATYSSTAVKTGVNAALAAYDAIK